MTAPATKTVRIDGEKQAGANVRRGGRNFMIAFYAALRAIKLYPLEHSAVQKTLAELAQVAEELRTEEGDLEFRISGEFIFLNETRLRLDLSNYATFGHILTLAKLAGIGAIHVGNNGTARDWQLLLSLLGAETKSAPPEGRSPARRGAAAGAASGGRHRRSGRGARSRSARRRRNPGSSRGARR